MTTPLQNPVAPPAAFRRRGSGVVTSTPPGAGFLPLVRDLPAGLTSVDCFKRLAGLPHCLWFDGASEPDGLGRYSFLTADPVELIRTSAENSDPLAPLVPICHQLQQASRSDLPPFQGGLAGLFGYELGTAFERLDPAPRGGVPSEDLCVGWYDWTIAFDHLTGKAWIVSQGFPETTLAARRTRAGERIDQILALLAAPPATLRTISAPCEPPGKYKTHVAGIQSNFDATRFRAAVDLIRTAIRRGDCFQVNLAQQLQAKQEEPAELLALRLRQANPAPMAGYFDAGAWQLISASPERFVRIEGRRVETRPIKGTAPRLGDPDKDEKLAARLLASEKDRAENVMIVDLMRNDLSRVCTDDSIRVPELCQLYRYAYVQHLVSTVVGELRPAFNVLDLLRASFPAGSITGAPKIQAMKMIAELEGVRRGPYCGSLGYISTGGRCDFSVLIRTLVAAGGQLTFPVGGGITAASEPAAEYQETWDKAYGILQALKGNAGCFW